MQMGCGPDNRYWIGFGSGVGETPPGTGDNNWHIWRAKNVIGGADDTLHIEGVEKISGNAFDDNAEGITVGSRYDGNAANCFDGYISEIVIIDPSMSDVDRGLLETYLSNKWDISI